MQRQCYFDHINQIKHCRFCILSLYLQMAHSEIENVAYVEY